MGKAPETIDFSHNELSEIHLNGLMLHYFGITFFDWVPGQFVGPGRFYRANRKAIVNIDAITRIEVWFNGKLIVKTRPPFPGDIIVSRDKASGFKQWLDH